MQRRVVANGCSERKPPKPEKPYPDFPLTAHASGKWCKKVRGKLHYFGSWSDPIGALNEWLAKEHLIRSGAPERDNTQADIRYLLNLFLDSKEQAVEHGDLTQKAYKDYQKACDLIRDHFGLDRLLSTLDAPDFQRFRASFPNTWNAVSINSHIARLNAVFNFAFEVGAIDRPIRRGPNFKRVSKKRQRLEKAKKPTKLYDAREIHRMIGAASFQMRAMILLGINCGFGNADCGRLQIPMIDFKRNWLEGLREKTAVERASWLWPETVEALQFAIDNKFSNAPTSLEDNVFITKRRQSWYKESGSADPLSTEFRKLNHSLGLHQRGRGFYSLRHTFETIAGNCKDQIAVNFVMGHSDSSMAEVYRHGIAPKRIVDVCTYVRNWFMRGKYWTVKMKLPTEVLIAKIN
ncbi:tyrosine-type recombinase/integrase [Rhodopirellula sp. MGV]|uniref:tyrosine-type recombinase/integrase n=1 Tax=Rhodopirellula sp. MGV TaxID=2023130 RepID=UPI000B96F3E4|nr:tyrosine-type recombinase/integrase [Rhodopirellula sp. MGV]OYP38909.1 hypothetical protein CGZ80_01430 [Rhodopirellula sp. MGV]PNY38277.1 site-specific integrase [Rhodopirellula baltica]